MFLHLCVEGIYTYICMWGDIYFNLYGGGIFIYIYMWWEYLFTPVCVGNIYLHLYVGGICFHTFLWGNFTNSSSVALTTKQNISAA